LVGSTIIKVEAITTKHDEDIYYIHLCNGKILTGIDGEYGSDALSILDEPEEVKSRRTL
jgi:hypothetical protein